jgi:serine/threonine protein kinase
MLVPIFNENDYQTPNFMPRNPRLQILYEVKSPYVVGFYGSCFSEADLSILMEYLDGGSLDTIYRRLGTIPEDMLARITGDILKVCGQVVASRAK